MWGIVLYFNTDFVLFISVQFQCSQQSANSNLPSDGLSTVQEMTEDSIEAKCKKTSFYPGKSASALQIKSWLNLISMAPKGKKSAAHKQIKLDMFYLISEWMVLLYFISLMTSSYSAWATWGFGTVCHIKCH